ncbi:unnamed protein product [Ostreobium quekettii]|uniref:Coenzyme Q-binding protein COQ10 START domain-containing protein n=1 Tax=Ostreobium quekettii TaxID=121088 RepID=A0A8S1J3F4_9CHLO|nr:unnamed protein product [Ostreobium quekettii]
MADGDGAEGVEAPVDLSSGEWSDPSNDRRVVATDSEGFLCRITLRARLSLSPEETFAVFTNPDNSSIFRDVYGVRHRHLVSDDGQGVKVFEVEQISGFNFVAIPIRFSTRLFVEQDARAMRVSFRLARPGNMKELNGVWTMLPVDSPVGGTFVTLEQDVLPAFVPPLLGRFLKGISVNAARRMLEDLDAVAARVRGGEPLDAVLGREAELEESNQSNGLEELDRGNGLASDGKQRTEGEGLGRVSAIRTIDRCRLHRGALSMRGDLVHRMQRMGPNRGWVVRCGAAWGKVSCTPRGRQLCRGRPFPSKCV